jgi:hypothetical protein
MRKRTGLRNRRRTGRSTYSLKGKGKTAERYTRPYLTGEYLKWEKAYAG